MDQAEHQQSRAEYVQSRGSGDHKTERSFNVAGQREADQKHSVSGVAGYDGRSGVEANLLRSAPAFTAGDRKAKCSAAECFASPENLNGTINGENVA